MPIYVKSKQHQVPGISGSVKGAILQLFAYEAGQSAVVICLSMSLSKHQSHM